MAKKVLRFSGRDALIYGSNEMNPGGEHAELVRQAQLGNEESRRRLAETASVRLRAYIYRMTLASESVDDIVQESILEMFRILGKLRDADRFWPWLYRIALNKVKHQGERYQSEQRARQQAGEYKGLTVQKQEALEKLVSDELRQIVSKAMGGLKTRHRAVLSMRCYDDMSYSEIGESMGCSEFAARMLFCRAKRALQRQLARQGLGRGALLTALVLFGKMTAPSEAAAKISVTAASLKAGVLASTAVLVSSKAVIVPFAAAGALTVGTMAVTSSPDNTMIVHNESPAKVVEAGALEGRESGALEEWWYYFPEGTGGPVMMRQMKRGTAGSEFCCALRQNEEGNYYFDERENKLFVKNSRMWRSDLGVWQLPTDEPDLRRRLSQSADEGETVEYVDGAGDGFLVISRRGGEQEKGLEVVRRYNILEEEYFRYTVPAGLTVVDCRDAMHKRGWTYFRISGRVRDLEVSGTGRVPFVYAARREHWPWMRLTAGGREFAGRSFAGFGRPWEGLHTIDVVRRDAAGERIQFETRYMSETGKAEVKLSSEKGELVYTIDMEMDVVEKITFAGSTGEDWSGELEFSYLGEVDDIEEEFISPRKTGNYTRLDAGGDSVYWPLKLASAARD
jgi:RNA polymerase sigma-70 factor (ECF subfamily)